MTLDLSNPDAAVVAEVVARAHSGGYEEWWAKVTESGFCASPVRLVRGDSIRQAAVLARCKNRRASVCPSCAQLYAGDTWQLVHRGISDEETDGGHLRRNPMLFVTLTAPSFGAVHSAVAGIRQPCRLDLEQGPCRHGRPRLCAAIHQAGDPALGQPLCADCYDYVGQVLFTWHAPELWHRFAVGLRRRVRRRGSADSPLRVAYIKVVEMQRRAVPHFHAVIRVDADSDDAIETEELVILIRKAASRVSIPESTPYGPRIIRLGEQIDVRTLDQLSGRQVAAYLAKYVTKSVGDFGLAARRLHEGVIGDLQVSDHLRRILWTIADLGHGPERREMGKWLHTLGYRGHVTTKTRQYSTTMGELRARREEWKRQHSSGSVNDLGQQPDLVEWEYVGCGHATEGERFLALSAAGRNREIRGAARDALAQENGGV